MSPAISSCTKTPILPTFFNSYLCQPHKSGDICRSAFKHDLSEDPELRDRPKDWCHEVGSSEKRGSWTILMNTLPDRTK